MNLGVIGGIAYQTVLFALVGFAAGELVLQWSGLLPSVRRPVGNPGGFVDEAGNPASGGFNVIWVGITERILSAAVGSVAFSVALMIGHIVTRGLLFGTPGVVPAAGAVVVVLWWRRREPLPRPRPVSYLKVGVLVAALLAIYLTPALVSGSSVRTGDPPWHLGWTEQLLAGEPVPTGPAPEFGRNAYPWGLHAAMATMTRLAPGTDPLTSLESLHFLLISGAPLAAACLAFRLRKDSGWAAAAAASLIGGWGWISAGGPDFVTSPGSARYGADLVVASPNSVYELFPPALPRELGIMLLGASALFALIAARNRLPRVELLAGATAGLTGLVSVPMFVSALVWLGAASLLVPHDRGRFARRAFGAAAVVFGLWALPVVIDYVRYSGFVDITPRLGVEWPLHLALASWGLLLPLAALGIYLSARRRDVEERIMLGFLVASGLLLLAAILRGAFDWGLSGNATLLHQGRVWPPFHLLAAVLAGPAVMWLYERLRPRALAVGAVAGILVVGAISPVFASIHLTDLMDRGAGGFIYGGPDIQDPDSFVRRAARVIGPDDVVVVEGSDNLAFLLFQFSGATLARYDHPDLTGNELRVRFRDLASQWDERMADGGFEPDFVVIESDHSLITAGDGTSTLVLQPPVLQGQYEGTSWVLFEMNPRNSS